VLIFLRITVFKSSGTLSCVRGHLAQAFYIIVSTHEHSMKCFSSMVNRCLVTIKLGENLSKAFFDMSA